MDEVLWEDIVPLIKQGVHEDLAEKAYSCREKVFPLEEHVFDAMRVTSFRSTKVVIIGQDPYFNERAQGPEAHGLSFSVQEGMPMPPSLRNILKEINSSLYDGNAVSTSTNLHRWAEQGVLLLNASLTVIAKKPNSHAGLGWHELTDNIIETLSRQREGIVFMLWGAFARKKAKLIDGTKHCIIETTHPSPLSAHRGFTGSGVFVQCNEYLQEKGGAPITW